MKKWLTKQWLKLTLKIAGRTKMFKKIVGWFSGKKLYMTAVAGIMSELAKVAETGDVGSLDWDRLILYFGMIFGRQAIAKGV